MAYDIYQRFTVRIGKKQTSVSISPTLAALLSLRLAGRVEHGVVRRWCQERIDEDPGAYTERPTRRLSELAALEIARPKLVEQYWQHKLGG